jgi:hypothetical protein
MEVANLPLESSLILSFCPCIRRASPVPLDKQSIVASQLPQSSTVTAPRDSLVHSAMDELHSLPLCRRCYRSIRPILRWTSIRGLDILQFIVSMCSLPRYHHSSCIILSFLWKSCRKLCREFLPQVTGLTGSDLCINGSFERTLFKRCRHSEFRHNVSKQL